MRETSLKMRTHLMKTFLFILIPMVLVAVYLFLTRKRKEDPKPSGTTLPLQPRVMRQPPHRRRPKPSGPVRTVNGATYYPVGNNIYRNSEDDSTLTWLMLYLLLSDEDRNTYATPVGYVEGMTLAEAEAETGYQIIAHEFRQTAPEPLQESAAAAAPDATPAPADDTSHRHVFDPSPASTPSNDSSSSSSYDSGSSYSSSSYDSGSSYSSDSGSSSFD